MVTSKSSKYRYALAATYVLGLMVISFVFPVNAHAATAGAGLPWEQPLQNIQHSIQGPVASVICFLGIIGLGANLVWGGEVNEFLRRGIYLVLTGALVVGASGVMNTLFAATGAIL